MSKSNNAEAVRALGLKLIEAFRSGAVPEALAKILILREDPCPSANYSITNRLLLALQGTIQAAGYKTWPKFGRSVMKGAKARRIFAPLTYTAKEDDPENDIFAGDVVVSGFRAVPVFGLEQTEGEPLPGYEGDEDFIASLPLIDLARTWGIDVRLVDAASVPFRGQLLYGADQPLRIYLAVENLGTWAHEMVHAADLKLGTLTRGKGQKMDNEVVAQLGAAVLLKMLELDDHSDPGFTWEYIKAYAEKEKVDPLTACSDLLDRTVAAVDLILTSAEELAATPVLVPQGRGNASI